MRLPRRTFFSLGASLTRQTSISMRKKYPLKPRVRLRCVPIMNITFPQVRESRFRNPQNVCFWNLEFGNFIWWNLESWILKSIIQLKVTGMALTIGMRNPSSFDKESGIQNPRLSWIPLHGANNYVVFFKESQWCRKKEYLLKQGKRLSPQTLYHHFTVWEKSFEN